MCFTISKYSKALSLLSEYHPHTYLHFMLHCWLVFVVHHLHIYLFKRPNNIFYLRITPYHGSERWRLLNRAHCKATLWLVNAKLKRKTCIRRLYAHFTQHSISTCSIKAVGMSAEASLNITIWRVDGQRGEGEKHNSYFGTLRSRLRKCNWFIAFVGA